MTTEFEDIREQLKFVCAGVAQNGHHYSYPNHEAFDARTTEAGSIEKSYETYNWRCAFFESGMIDALRVRDSSKFESALFKWFLVVPLDSADDTERRKEAEQKFRDLPWFDWAGERIDEFMAVIHILYEAIALRAFIVAQSKAVVA